MSILIRLEQLNRIRFLISRISLFLIFFNFSIKKWSKISQFKLIINITRIRFIKFIPSWRLALYTFVRLTKPTISPK